MIKYRVDKGRSYIINGEKRVSSSAEQGDLKKKKKLRTKQMVDP